MTSTRPYLIRAMYEWMVDNDCTPYLLVDATQNQVTVPEQHIENGTIVLNVSPGAVRDLDLGNEWILFSARFSGSAIDISFPVHAVQAIYARENGQGIFLGEQQDEDVVGEKAEAKPDPEKPRNKPAGGRPNLTLVK